MPLYFLLPSALPTTRLCLASAQLSARLCLPRTPSPSHQRFHSYLAGPITHYHSLPTPAYVRIQPEKPPPKNRISYPSTHPPMTRLIDRLIDSKERRKPHLHQPGPCKQVSEQTAHTTQIGCVSVRSRKQKSKRAKERVCKQVGNACLYDGSQQLASIPIIHLAAHAYPGFLSLMPANLSFHDCANTHQPAKENKGVQPD